jgi:hypothetical protein
MVRGSNLPFASVLRRLKEVLNSGELPSSRVRNRAVPGYRAKAGHSEVLERAACRCSCLMHYMRKPSEQVVENR